jgi:exopolysaccharide biosynthesis polyprenyl glycosylphosphotransferase
MPMFVASIPVLVDSVSITLGFSLGELPNPFVAAFICVLCLSIAGTYRCRLTLSGLDLTPAVATASAIGAVLSTVVNDEHVELRDLVLPIGAASLAALMGRFVACSLARLLRHSSLLRRRVVVVGMDAVGTALTQTMLKAPEHGLEPILLLDDESMLNITSSQRVPLHPVDSTARMILKAERIDTAVIAFPQLDAPTFQALLFDFDQLGFDILVVPRMWDSCPVGGDWDRIGAVPIMRIRQPMHRNPMRHMKAVGERGLAAAALLILAPLLGTVAGLQKLLHPRAPVLFCQTRVGQHGREFKLLKFRSMTPVSEVESQTTWTIMGDSRVDAFGRFLRASSIDELPQLWNIVRGDMALIGPRPERPHFVEQFSSTIPGYHARHRVPVGLTGWAAVNGLSGDTSIAERARYDNFYITNWSLWLDIKIVLRTMWALVVRFREGRSQELVARRGTDGSRGSRMLSEGQQGDLTAHDGPEMESLCPVR